MSRTGMSGTARAIRIDDEVWQDAFATRVPSSRSRRASIEPRPRSVGHRPRSAVDHDRPVESHPARAATALAEPAAALALHEPPSASTVDLAGLPARPSPAARSARPTRDEAPVAAAPRTVRIQGRGAERNLPLPAGSARRRSRPLHQRSGFSPDRIAMWAMFLGLLLVLVAAISSHA